MFTETHSCLPAAFSFSFTLSLAMVGLFVWLARRMKVYALPGARRSHTGTVPTGGGLGLIAAISVVSWAMRSCPEPVDAWLTGVIPGALLLSLIGWLDDRRPISPVFRLVVQLAVSFGLLALLRKAGLEWSWPFFLVGGIMLVWLMNLYNFMDGSHGMAGFEGVFAGAVISFAAWQAGNPSLAAAAGIVAAACAGFLPWNFPVPRIFMGDAGSVPIGFILGSLIFTGWMAGSISLPVGVLLLSVFLVDSSLTLAKRVFRGERWYTPHSQHVYQRLIAQGWSHSRVLWAYQAVNLVVVVPAIVLVEKVPAQAWLITIAVVSVMSTGWFVASSRLEMRS